jgi:hypothetical protein
MTPDTPRWRTDGPSRCPASPTGRLRPRSMGLMAWEWVAPVAGSVTAVAVGITGIVATYKAGNRQQATALAVARQQSDAQVAVAREERQQRRLEEAYLEMLAAITSIHYWVYTVYPIITQTPEQFTMPPLPELPDSASKEALWTAYWSPRVEQLMKNWEAAVRKLQSTGMRIGIGRSTEQSGQVSGIDVPTLLLELEDQKREVINADRHVREQIRLELLGQHDGHAEEVAAGPSPPS